MADTIWYSCMVSLANISSLGNHLTSARAQKAAVRVKMKQTTKWELIFQNCDCSLIYFLFTVLNSVYVVVFLKITYD